ncbi:hypothetical protein RCL1_003464 [Eukaryota sp. TZLM3-RCL]
MTGVPILLVGAGGIGCEALKALLCVGFTDIDVIDLDTIDFSNLNRQFLFKREDVGQSKAITAAKVVSKRFPKARVNGIMGDVFSFTVQDISKYSLVLNALDNLPARRHVNSLCVLAKVPLLDAGTMGYSGQTAVHFPPFSQCYDCDFKKAPAQLPVCTIRGIPTKDDHVIAWGKAILESLINSSETMFSDLKLDFEQNIYDLIVKLFITEPRVNVNLAENTGRVRYNPITEEHVIEILNGKMSINYDCLDMFSTWSLDESLTVFAEAFHRLGKQSRDLIGTKFDKSNSDQVKFIASASIIRSLIFNLIPSTPFKIQEKAGNIVPAIATANAIVAAIMVNNAKKVLRDSSKSLSASILLNYSSTHRFVISKDGESIQNPDCLVCNSTMHKLFINFDSKLSRIIEILKSDFGVSSPVIGFKDAILYDEDEEINNLIEKSLIELKLESNAIISVFDNDSDSFDSFLVCLLATSSEHYSVFKADVVEKVERTKDTCVEEMSDCEVVEKVEQFQDDDDCLVVEEEEEAGDRKRIRPRGGSPALKAIKTV